MGTLRLSLAEGEAPEEPSISCPGVVGVATKFGAPGRTVASSSHPPILSDPRLAESVSPLVSQPNEEEGTLVAAMRFFFSKM